MNSSTDGDIYHGVAVQALKELYELTASMRKEPKRQGGLLTYWKQMAFFGVLGAAIAIPMIVRLLV